MAFDTMKMNKDIPNLVREFENLSRTELVEIYKVYSQKYISSIDTQWKITALFIPLSMGGVVVAGKEPMMVTFVGLFSILLIWIWFLLERRNGKELRICNTVVVTIESMLAKQDFKGKNLGFSVPRPKTGSKLRFTVLFRIISIAITLAWIIVIAYRLVKHTGS